MLRATLRKSRARCGKAEIQAGYATATSSAATDGRDTTPPGGQDATVESARLAGGVGASRAAPLAVGVAGAIFVRWQASPVLARPS